MFCLNFFKSKEEKEEEVTKVSKVKVGIRKLLENINKPIDITLSTKDSYSSIGTHEKRLILKAILDIYNIKADLKEPRKRVKKVKEVNDAE